MDYHYFDVFRTRGGLLHRPGGPGRVLCQVPPKGGGHTLSPRKARYVQIIAVNYIIINELINMICSIIKMPSLFGAND